ncbi:MAG TPA: M23 family metallopeptidase [Novosphingobium sp.]|nr:M23 family metallopeptidase [Novosphingobium sp.]
MRGSRRAVLAGLAAAGWQAGSGPWTGRAKATSPALPFGPLCQGGWMRGFAPPGAQAVSLDGQPVPLAQGRFFLGFDRDAPPGALLRIDEASFPLAIAPRAWAIEQVNAPFHPPGLPDATFAALRTGELARIHAARARATDAAGWNQPFQRPAEGRFSGFFGAQRIYQGGVAGAYHGGLDIAAAAGTPYRAPAAGVVVLAAEAPFTLEGNLLILDHGMGLNSAFLHASALLVREGEAVAQGQPLGLVGQTGRATGPHLHWAVMWHSARLDPLLLLPAPLREGHP